MKTNAAETPLEQAVALEKEAQQLRSQGKIEEAFSAYDGAASLYQEAKEHLKAALCFASAASCWNIRTGLQPLRNAATRTHQAAQEAMKAHSFHYARSLFLDAALLYEKEGDFGNYSICFYGSKQAERKLGWTLFIQGRKGDNDFSGDANWKERFSGLGRWGVNWIGCMIWGYGERPFRTFAVALGVILISALVYSVSGQILTKGGLRGISFYEGLYMSVITYTTVGFGDYLPVGWVRIFAMLEALSGIFFAPLFLIALTRRYLRMYR